MHWIILILLICASSLYADNLAPSEDIDAGFNVDDRPIIRQLAAPCAIDRLEAMIECKNRDLLNKTLINRLWKDWKYVLVEVLEYTWPAAADDLVKEMYNTPITNQYYYNWAYVLYKWEKFQYLDTDFPICETIRDNVFESYIERSSEGYTFKDKYIYIAKRDWMYKRFLQSTYFGINDIDKEILQFFADKLINPKTSVGQYLIELLNTGKIDTTNFSGTMIYDTDLGAIHPALIATILLDRPDVAKTVQKKLSTILRHVWKSLDPSKVVVKDSQNEIVNIMLATPAEAMKLLEDFFQKSIDYNTKCIMHHPWFAKLRSDSKFKEWWHDVKINVDLEDPDPSFEHVNYNR